MAVGDAHVFSGFLTPVLTQLSFHSHWLLFSNAVAEVRGENMLESKFASAGYLTHNQQVMNPTHSPLSHPILSLDLPLYIAHPACPSHLWFQTPLSLYWVIYVWMLHSLVGMLLEKYLKETYNLDKSHSHAITHSHTMTPFDAPGKQAFRKHCGKRRNCSWRAISPFPTVFSTHLDNFLPLSSNLKLSSANSFSLEESKICCLVMG